MANDHIPTCVLYGDLVTGTHTVVRPYLRDKDTCKHDMKMAEIDINSWETVENGDQLPNVA